MTTMTMPATVERSQSDHKKEVSQIVPFLVGIALFVAVGVVSVLISGPMH
jgi:hypothetical protein